jgi:hypothetical protein
VDSFILLDWISSLEKKQQKSTAAVRDDDEDADEVSHRVTWLHCSIGAEMEEGKDDGDDESAQVRSSSLNIHEGYT